MSDSDQKPLPSKPDQVEAASQQGATTKAIYESLEKYIPAPLIATFIAINAIVSQGEYDSFVPSFDRWLMLIVAIIFSVIMFIYLKWTQSYRNTLVRILISASIFCWCVMIAEERFAGLVWWPIVSVISGIYVMILLLVLTLFEINKE